MATKCKLSLAICVFFLHSISFCTVHSRLNLEELESSNIIDVNSPIYSHIRHIRHRLKRDVTTITVERLIREDASNPILNVRTEVNDANLRVFTFAGSSIMNLLNVDVNGAVSVSSGQKLDYDNPETREIVMQINATKTTDQTDVVILQITIKLQNVNDEDPVFKNQPTPFLATVPPGASSNTKVFELYAEDPDGNEVVYTFQSGGEQRFEVKTTRTFSQALNRNIYVGDVLTKGSGTFSKDEYQLVISAADATEPTQSNIATVFVKVGVRPPQFYEDGYKGNIREHSSPNQLLEKELRVQAKSFQNKTITYQLVTGGPNSTDLSPYFTVDPSTGVLKTTSTLTKRDLDYESVPKKERPPEYTLTVRATEAETGLASTTTLVVQLIDDNDNPPIFEYSRYQGTIPENTPLGTSILEVKAVDQDSGRNAEIVYSVDDGNFTIETYNDSVKGYIGIIKVKEKLDYDRIVGHMYSFTVTATDRGSVSRTGTANVRVTVTNVNDEPPEIQIDNSIVFSVREDAQVGYVVTFIQAIDLDGDRVKFYFSPRSTTSGIFSINSDSGLIKLEQKVPQNVDKYVLNITAEDDGSCCGGTTFLSSEAYLVVEIVDVNEHKPTFPNCSSYSTDASVDEHKPVDTFVLTVKAIDEDRNENGRVTYSILRSISQQTNRFKIDRDSGNVTTAVVFDRETVQSYSITVKGNDQANPSLEGYCTFRISIGDINDNSPVFDQPQYKVTIKQDYGVGRSVANVRADDKDVGPNAEIEYFLISNPDNMFRIEQDAGIIYLNKTLSTQSSYDLTVMAKDKGVPPLNTTVSVIISIADITSKPPEWLKDYNKVYNVEETVAVRHVIANFSAISNVEGNANVNFKLIDTDGNPVNTLPPFTIEQEGQVCHLLTQSALDFNIKNLYELRIRVTNYNLNPLSSEISPKIKLLDMNNKVPYFVGISQESSMYPGSVAENTAPGQVVIDVKAFDDDKSDPDNKLTFSIVESADSKLFRISKLDDNTARIYTTESFDREQVQVYFIKVKVIDGKASDIIGHTPPNTPNSAVADVQVRITDQNDNHPYFEYLTYNATVREDAGLQTSIIMVTATDPDTADVLTYSITDGNTRNAFGVQSKKGIIFVARQLDYDSGEKSFNLTLMVSDGLYTNTTRVLIKVEDVNDNRPQFDKNVYTVLNVVEEDSTITPTNRRFLLQVNATDRDEDRPNNIRYSLLGYGTSGINKYFDIDPESGNLYLLLPLDRDLPNGRAIYQFNVRAMDEPQNPDTAQYGFSSVQVMPQDINDNIPFFDDKLSGKVAEHAARGTPVMNIIARDYDFGENASVVYNIPEGPAGQDQFQFSIDPETGVIRTATDPSNLDRETLAQYSVLISAHDKGPNTRTATTTATITLLDINDQIPKFQQKYYNVTMSEAQKSGSIASVRATDKDIGENARLEYSLDQIDREYFSINGVNNEGIILVYKALDYEDENQREFNLTVTVQDINPNHQDKAYVYVRVEDFNDNAPEFVSKSITKEVEENIPVGEVLATFSANDKDSGINAQFKYSIDTTTDKRRQFQIDEITGVVSVRRSLDRETIPVHYVTIQAIDEGDPQMTGTAQLIVKLIDVNDNYPIFKEDYRPVVPENSDAFPSLVVRVHGKDLDTPQFGAPFGFGSPVCSGGLSCPCPEQPTCQFFSLTFNASGDKGNGEGIVRTLARFDREKTKFYYMPIVMWDMRDSQSDLAQTGTNTLTIEIGDVNDNKHGPGHKDIFVYNYEGKFGNLEIGNVYAADPDDWDVVDKTYTFIGPDYMSKYFTVNEDTGMITLKKNVPVDKEYTFRVKVFDRVWQHSAESTVTVTIKNLSEEAVLKSGAMRLTGTTAEQFMNREKDAGDLTAYKDSINDKFRKLLASKISAPVENVEVVSVMNNGEFTDIRYTAHGSPYYDASKTDSVIALNKKEFEDSLGIKIAMVPIDECRDEKFEGGCYNFLNVTGQPAMVNTNGSSFVGVETHVVALEGCRADNFPSPSNVCQADYCYNGGECIKDDWNVLSCKCPIGFNGPRCQGTHHGFDGNSFALFKPLEQCKNGQTSIEFMTEQANGLILYNGPTEELQPDDPEDYISLELVDGYPKLRIDHGTGELVLQIDGSDKQGNIQLQKLNDGRWHHIEIIREGKYVQMIVDRCEKATRVNSITTDDNACRKSGSTPNSNQLLNVNTLLQLGGRAEGPPSRPADITNVRFNGCVKNLRHNGQLYNLHIGGTPGYPAGYNGCQKEEEICGVNSIEGPFCGMNGLCTSTLNPDGGKFCTCKPGFFGDKCSSVATTKDLEEKSFLKWKLKDAFFNDLNIWKTDMQVNFRTRDSDGIIMTVSTPDKDMHVTLKLSNGSIVAQYSFGNTKEQSLVLRNNPAHDGRWHTVQLKRFGNQFYLTLDGGEGRNYAYTLGQPGEKETINIERFVYSGASVSVSSSVDLISNDLSNTCMQDVRLYNEWFPMDINENSKSSAAELQKSVHIIDGCVRKDCQNVTCDGIRVCYPLWGAYECRCPDGYKDENGICVQLSFCEMYECVAGTCDASKGMCICEDGWKGVLCNEKSPDAVVASLSTGALVAIIICIFIVLLLALVMIIFVRFTKRPKDSDKYVLEVDPDDDIRENVMNYDEEGAGEEDHDAFDISRLQKPDDIMYMGKSPLNAAPRTRMPGLGRAPRPGEDPDVGGFIDDRLGDADDDPNAPPGDSVCEYAYEGGGSDAGSLSSLNTTSSDGDQDYDYLNDWGPKFAKLADMYGAGNPGSQSNA